MPLKGQLRLLELEKKQAERDKMGVEFQLKDAAQTNVQLQTTIGEMKSRVSELEGQLTSTTSKLTHILNTQGLNFIGDAPHTQQVPQNEN
jgi:hypothetical protein